MAKAGKRPDRATIVYSNMVRQAFPHIPVAIGGIEASLRRAAHYDYWSNKVRHSILTDSGADILMYGMGELSSVQIADALNAGIPVSEITYVDGTCYRTNSLDNVYDYIEMPSYQEVCSDKKKYCRAFMLQMEEADGIRGKRLVQGYEKGYIVINPPSAPLTIQQMDEIYSLPYMRLPHLPIKSISLRLTRRNFLSPRAADALADVLFVRLPIIRGGLCRYAAMITSSQRQKSS